MILKYAQGHNNSASVATFPYEPRTETAVEFEVEVAASGLAKAVGGGTVRMIYDYLEIEEAQTLLPFLGINSRVPSTACTLQIQDLFGIPLFYNGYVDLIMPRGGQKWWVDFGLEFRALERI